MKILAWGLGGLVATLSSSVSFACNFCMLGQGISPYLTSNGRGLTLDVNYTESDHIYNQSTSIDAHGKQEAWLVYTLTGFYSVTEDFSVLVGVPYSSKTNVDFDADTGKNPGVLVSGLGDASLTGRYTLYRLHSFDSTLIGGLIGGFKFPTGTTSTRGQDGQPVDRHVLAGTGSLDYDLGLSGSYATASGFQVTADVVYSLAGPGKWGGRDHRFGDSANFSVRGFYRVWPSTPGEKSIMPFVGFSGEHTGREKGTQTGAGYDPNLINSSSGGTVLYSVVGLYAVLHSDLMANISFQKAVYHDMNYQAGFDADPAENYKLGFGVTYLF